MDAGVDELHSVVIFRLGGQSFAIPAECVQEVVPHAWLAQPPRMPAFVRGVLNLGGVAIPVLRLDRLLGLPDGAYGLDASILIMRAASAPVGLLVEHVEGVHGLGEFQSLPLEAGRSLQGCVSGYLQGPLRQAALLSWQAILLQEEQLRLEDFQRHVDTRLAELADGIS